MKLQETVAGQAEATRLLSNIDHLIAVQPFTSDRKKTWPIAKWKRTIELIADVEPDFSFGILCGPGEQEAAMALVRSLKSKLIDAHILECSLEGAFSILKKASLLITGDTSIKHMAAGAGLPIVELSIGSSSFERTGAYTDNVVILQAKQECAPCEHSSICPFESPECHDKISAEAVALVSQTVLQRRWTDLRIVANEFSDSILFLRGDFSWEGEWRAVPLSQSFQGRLALEWIDRASQKLFLNGTHEAVLALGSEGVQVRRLFSEAYPQTLPADRMDVYRRLEVDLKAFKSELEAIASELKILVQNFQSLSGVDPLKKRIQKVVGMFGTNVGFASYVNRLRELATEISESDNEFFQIRKSREILASQLQRVDIEQRLIATLRNQELEVL